LTAHTDVRTDVLDIEPALGAIGAIMPVDQKLADALGRAHKSEQMEILTEAAHRVYDQREASFTPAGMRVAERLSYLRTLDSLWIEHLEAMDGLREGIGLRAIGQREPLVEYKREGFRLFQSLMGLMERELANLIFKVTITPINADGSMATGPIETALTRAASAATASSGAPDEAKPAPKRADAKTKEVGRNDLCPCGSGLKYKKCGLINAPEHLARMKQSQIGG